MSFLTLLKGMAGSHSGQSMEIGGNDPHDVIFNTPLKEKQDLTVVKPQTLGQAP